MKNKPWIGVDLDGTLAKQGVGPVWHGDKKEHRNFMGIGPIVEPMKERVEEWLAKGIEVRILTARVAGVRHGILPEDNKEFIKDWLEFQGLPRLQVTSVKDFFMLELYDDRAVQVEFNTGRIIGESTMHHRRLFKQL